MLKSDELATSTSCLNSAAMNEPVFVLRANDELAAGVVRQWALRYRLEKLKQPGGMTKKQADKWHEAHDLANQMDVWRDNQNT